MSVLDELLKQKQLYATCPNCNKEFRLADALLFDATKPLPELARFYLSDARQYLKDERKQLKENMNQARTKPKIVAESVGIGKVIEKIAPSLPGFPVDSADCRALFEPIDYVVFHGLTKRGRVDAIYFADVKSGEARLQPTQKQIKSVVERGEVRLVIAQRPKEV